MSLQDGHNRVGAVLEACTGDVL